MIAVAQQVKCALVCLVVLVSTPVAAADPARFLWAARDGGEHYMGISESEADCRAMATALSMPHRGTAFYCRSKGEPLPADTEHHRLVAVSTKGDSERAIGVFRGCHSMAGVLNFKLFAPNGEVAVCR